MDIITLKHKTQTAIALVEEMLDILDLSEPYDIYLIGSQAEGTATEKSDWDFLVVGEDFDEVEDERGELFDSGELPKRLGLEQYHDPKIGKGGQVDIIFSSNIPKRKNIKVVTKGRNIIGTFLSQVNSAVNIRLYRGLTQKFDSQFKLSKTDAPHGYSTWTDNLELAKQYAGQEGYVYYIDLPKSEMGNDVIDENGDRVLFFCNEKPCGLHGVKGKEYLVYNDHDLYKPSMIKKLNKTKTQAFLSRVNASASEFPYFHVTDYSGKPNKPYVYLGIKGRQYGSSFNWDRMKYFWNVKLKSGLKLFNPSENWDSGWFDSFAHKLDFKPSFKDTKNADVSFYGELIDEGKFKNLDDLVDQRPHYGFHILMDFGGNKFFDLFKQEGYHGIFDEDGKYLYEAADITKEPQVLIFDPNDIIWGKRKNNTDFEQFIKAQAFLSRVESALKEDEKEIIKLFDEARFDNRDEMVKSLEKKIERLKREQWKPQFEQHRIDSIKRWEVFLIKLKNMPTDVFNDFYAHHLLQAYSMGYHGYMGEEDLKALENYYKQKPEAFKNMDKGMEYETLWRTVAFDKKGAKNFLDSGYLKPINIFESWSHNRKFVREWMEKELGDNDSYDYFIIFKKNIPESARIVSLTKTGIGREEGEILCHSKTLKVSDVESWYYRKNLQKLGSAILKIDENTFKSLVNTPNKTQAFLSRVESGITNTDFPYYHVSNHPELPTLKSDSKHFDPLGIYLFIKGEPITGSWVEKKYRWDAKIKNESDIIPIDHLNYEQLFYDLGIKNIHEYIQNLKELKTHDIDTLLEDYNSWKDEGTIPTHVYYPLLRDYFSDSNKFTQFLKNKGYKGIIDESGYNIFLGEPQIIIFDPDNIIWGEREENVSDDKVYRLHAEVSERQAFLSKVEAALKAREADGIVTQRVHPKSGRKRWALVSRKPDKSGKRRVLRWFQGKPSKKRVKSEEKRIQYFKHKK